MRGCGARLTSSGEPFAARPGSDRAMSITLRTGIWVVVGAIAGLAYQRFIGCRTGTCALTSNPYISAIYGAVMGYLLSGGLR